MQPTPLRGLVSGRTPLLSCRDAQPVIRMGSMVSRVWKLISDESVQYTTFVILTFLVFFSAVKVYSSKASAFQRFFGRIHPLVVLITLFFAGLFLFSFLLEDGRFAIYRSGNYKGILVALGLAIPFAVAMILVDTKFPFPENMNVEYPNSLFFYPAMGYAVELLFHVLPFSLLYLLFGRIFNVSGNQWMIWVILLIVALFEPVFQVAYASSQDSRGVLAYLGFHLFVINVVQLLLFITYDFVSMYSFRLSYYLLWHIVWGHARLGILF